MKRFVMLMMLASAVAILVACGGGGSSSPSPTIQSPTWQNDGNGFVQFITNDPQHYGWGYWNYFSSTYESPMSSVTAMVKKQSGSSGSGYGIIFCYQDGNNFYRLLIETDGHYILHAKVGGTYVNPPIIDWTASSNLNLGYGALNKVSVTRTGSNTFNIYFNDIPETSVTDYSLALWGSAGFYASIYDQAHENFPYTPVDVRFQMLSPISIP